jgi:hypothetical protein
LYITLQNSEVPTIKQKWIDGLDLFLETSWIAG